MLHRFEVHDVLEIGRASLNHVSGTDNVDLNAAIKSRLLFRLDILEMLDLQTAGHSPTSSEYENLSTTLQQLEASHDAGKEFSDAFSTKIQRRLASTVPPRPMVTVSMSEAWNFWRLMIANCQHVFTVIEARHSQDLLTAYQIFAYNDPQISVYPRALLQSFLTREGMVTDRITARQFIEEDVLTLTLAASTIPQYPGITNVGVVRCFETFLDRFEQSFINLYRALCLNSCRIRRSFCHALIEWDNLQIEVEEMDTIIHQELGSKPLYIDGSDQFPFSLSSWVYHHKLCILEQTIQMGFDQMIYAPHELAGMYWYLSYVCDQHLQHLERITAFTTERKKNLPSTGTSEAEAARRMCKTAIDRQFRHFAYTRATSLLSMAVQGIFVVLQRHDIYNKDGPLHSNDDFRHEIRMKPFSNLTIPEALPANAFREETAMQYSSTTEVLDSAIASAVGARKAWEEIGKLSWDMFPLAAQSTDVSILQQKWSNDVKDCVKAAIAANLCLLTLKRGTSKPEWIEQTKKLAKIPQPGDKARRHRWWIIPELPPV